MPKRSGIRKKRNRWYFRVQIEGKRVEKGSFHTAEEAHLARIDYLKKHSREISPQYNFTVKEICIKYLDEHEKVYNRYPTAIKNEGICRNHIVPVLGSRKINELTPNDMRQFQKDCIEKKTTSVAYNTMRTLKKIFNWAVEWEYLGQNPIRGKLPPEPEKEHPTLNPQQIKDILQNVPLREKVVIGLGLFSGLRIGEIFGLRWEDINFSDNTLSVRRQFSSGVISEVKTKTSKAVIPIWSQLVTLLKIWKLKSGSPEWVFKGKRNNRPMRPERWR